MILAEFLKKSGCEANLARLMGEVIPAAVKRIRAAIEDQGDGYAGTPDTSEAAAEEPHLGGGRVPQGLGTNASGDTQLALDVHSNDIVVEELRKSKLVWWLASEELSDPEQIGSEELPFTVVFDPLDGSSLVDVNFAVGSIFGVYAWPKDHAQRFEKMQMPLTGDEQVAACYAVYGPRTTIVLTIKKGVHEFRLGADGNFHLNKENLTVKPDAKYFAPGNLRAAAHRDEYLQLVTDLIKKKLILRYSGGMVPDINHILLKGSGIFAYPGYAEMPKGKLRILFEGNPMALLMEQAGGAASDGKGRILAQQITEIHQQSPIFLGSATEVAACAKILA